MVPRNTTYHVTYQVPDINIAYACEQKARGQLLPGQTKQAKRRNTLTQNERAGRTRTENNKLATTMEERNRTKSRTNEETKEKFRRRIKPCRTFPASGHTRTKKYLSGVPFVVSPQVEVGHATAEGRELLIGNPRGRHHFGGR